VVAVKCYLCTVTATIALKASAASAQAREILRRESSIVGDPTAPHKTPVFMKAAGLRSKTAQKREHSASGRLDGRN
jgi:hypothetical protein